MEEEYDVVIIGASFAGLAVASKIKSGRVLLLDQKDLGKGVKSACGTPFYLIKRLGLEDTVLQLHKKIILHTSRGSLGFSLRKPFCVIDPERFSRRFFKMGRAGFLRTRVRNVDGETVETDKGSFRTRILVDASGPEAVSVKKKKPSTGSHLSFGIETILPYKEKGLHFWYQPKVLPKGVFWLFPQGETSRFGVGSYRGETNLKPHLDRFLAGFNLGTGFLHGGYFPHRLNEPVAEKIFLVGDAAGQCFPLTGEGIRPAIIFGQKCGEIIERILKGRLSLDKGLKSYREMVLSTARYYRLMDLFQELLISIPEALLYFLAWIVSREPVSFWALNRYLRIVDYKIGQRG